MTKEDNSLRSTILGTVIGGLILAAILAFVPKALTLLLSVLRWLLGILTIKLTMPVWGLLCFLLLLLLTLKIFSGRSLPRSSDAQPSEEHGPSLSQQEVAALVVLIKHDGAALSLGEISNALGASRLMTEHSLNNLFNKGMIQHTQNYLSGTVFRISPIGRDYAIEMGLIKS